MKIALYARCSTRDKEFWWTALAKSKIWNTSVRANVIGYQTISKKELNTGVVDVPKNTTSTSTQIQLAFLEKT